MTTDDAKAALRARQSADADALAARQAAQRTRLQFAGVRLAERHRREWVELGRRLIADADLLDTATPVDSGT